LQRVGLDGVHRFVGALAADERRRGAGEQAADDRHQQDPPPLEHAAGAQMLVGADGEIDLVEQLHQALDGDHADGDHDAEERAHQQQGYFVVPELALPDQAKGDARVMA
jgi:hypothetical protein